MIGILSNMWIIISWGTSGIHMICSVFCNYMSKYKGGRVLHYGWMLSSVSRCLELVMKHIVQVFDVFSNQTIRKYDMFSLVCIVSWVVLINKKSHLNASVWSQMKNMFHVRWKPGGVLSDVLSDLSTWSKWSSLILAFDCSK